MVISFSSVNKHLLSPLLFIHQQAAVKELSFADMVKVGWVGREYLLKN
jgi:hypothetical protein